LKNLLVNLNYVRKKHFLDVILEEPKMLPKEIPGKPSPEKRKSSTCDEDVADGGKKHRIDAG